MQIITGKLQTAQKVVIYGPEGIGKSTFASKFPYPLFIDTEGSTKHMDVARTPTPSSWQMLMEQIKYVKNNPSICKTLIVDTADWAEKLAISAVCDKAQKKGIEDFGYGKGYIYVEEEFGRFLNALSDLIELGINVVINAHAKMRKFEQPDEMGAYDRWELKLSKQTAPLLKEWADMVLFATYKTHVINVDGQGAEKGKNKAQGGKRVMHTTHHPCWDAKNRHELNDELPFDYIEISHCIPGLEENTDTQAEPSPPPKDEIPDISEYEEITPPEDPVWSEAPQSPSQANDDIPKPLADLMEENNVTAEEIQTVVAQKGYYPKLTPINNYDQSFISGVLVGAWGQVFNMIKANRPQQMEI